MEITTAWRMGWSNLANGALLAVAEQAGVEVFVTTDQSLRYQQNLAGRRIAILVLPTTRWPDIKPRVEKIHAALTAIKPGAYLEIVW